MPVASLTLRGARAPSLPKQTLTVSEGLHVRRILDE